MTRYPLDLAAARLGGRVLFANDEFFAGKENLVADAEPIFLPDKYVATGKWMDGWESRRRREPGHDYCIVRLGLRGVIDEVVVNTAYFRGNYPEACSIEACDVAGQPKVADLDASDGWVELLPRSPLEGDSKNRFAVQAAGPVTHLRLHIYPDGGVARLRVHGRAVPDWDRLDFDGGLVNLAAVGNGGRVLVTSDDFFGSGQNLIMPGLPADMSDGWETRRRRGPGHDSLVLALGAPGTVRRVELDTSHFKGNAPGRFWLEVCDAGDCAAEIDADAQDWTTICEDTLQPDLGHRFDDVAAARATHVRFNIHPDGGVARLRLWGKSARAEALAAGLARLNTLGADDATGELLSCCASRAWATAVAAARPLADVTTLMRTADQAWRDLGADDWHEAFAAHPRLGDQKAGADTADRWARGEQAGTAGADAATLEALAAGNRDYEQRFGHVFLLCATGKSAADMLAALRARLGNDADAELAIAAEEQLEITRLRLEKWLRQ